MFRNKRSQAKGVYYLFLYKQYLDNVYTQTAIHRFTLAPLHGVAHGCWATILSTPPFSSQILSISLLWTGSVLVS